MITSKLILLSGKAETGKTTIAVFLKEELEQYGCNVVVLSFADALKFWAKEYFSWDGKKDEDGRELLQQLGTNTARKNNPNIWVTIVHEFMKTFDSTFDFFILDDCRFENEIIYFQDKFHTDQLLTLRIERPDHVSKLNLAQQAHPSETALDDWDFDGVYINETKTLNRLMDDVRDIVDVAKFFEGERLIRCENKD